MASGDLTCSNATLNFSQIKTVVETLNLPANTDRIQVIPVANGLQICGGRLVREA
jgi:hypothetical protein